MFPEELALPSCVNHGSWAIQRITQKVVVPSLHDGSGRGSGNYSSELKGAAETHYTMAISVTASTAIEVSFILSAFISAFSSTYQNM
jgi:hypothetical protein